MARYRAGLDPKPREVSDAVERAVAVSEKADRLVNKAQFCKLTGFDRHTLDEWIAKGAPVEKPSKPRGEYTVDIRAMMDWKIAFEVERALKKSAPDGMEVAGFMGIADPYKAVQAMERYLKMGEQQKKLVHRDDMEAAMERAMGVIRQAVMAIPERIFRDMAGYPKSVIEKWRIDALKYCRDALAEGARILKDAVPDDRDA